MLKLSKIAPLPDWSRKFADPIPVQNRKPLATLRDAAQILSPPCRWPDQQSTGMADGGRAADADRRAWRRPHDGKDRGDAGAQLPSGARVSSDFALRIEPRISPRADRSFAH